jgi:glutathione S-transferase
LDKNLIGPDQAYVCGASLTLADYVGAEMITLGELVRCRYDAYPNIERWIGNMKALKSWPKVHEAHYGFVESVKDMPFEAI